MINLRQTLSLTLILLLFSCSDNKNVSIGDNPINPDRYIKLLSKYKLVSIDTLKIHYNSSDDDKKDKFYGTPLDSFDLFLFPSHFRSNYNFTEFFACYKFEIDSSRTGLITRTPSMYESSSIDLLVYDRHADSIVYYFEIAEEWGDAGAFFTKTSWVYNDTGKPTIFTIEDYSFDNSVDDVNDTTIERKTTSYLLQMNKVSIDTVSKNDTLFRLKFH